MALPASDLAFTIACLDQADATLAQTLRGAEGVIPVLPLEI
jgi:hypothetical protein